jgi:hypothetical protein
LCPDSHADSKPSRYCKTPCDSGGRKGPPLLVDTELQTLHSAGLLGRCALGERFRGDVTHLRVVLGLRVSSRGLRVVTEQVCVSIRIRETDGLRESG